MKKVMKKQAKKKKNTTKKHKRNYKLKSANKNVKNLKSFKKSKKLLHKKLKGKTTMTKKTKLKRKTTKRSSYKADLVKLEDKSFGAKVDDSCFSTRDIELVKNVVGDPVILGEGSFGTVYKACKKGKTNCNFALKVSLEQASKDETNIATIVAKKGFSVKEIDKFTCGNLGQKSGISGDTIYFLLLEKFDATLHRYMDTFETFAGTIGSYMGRLGENEAKQLCKLILDMNNSLHMMHLDMKPDNIGVFLDEKGKINRFVVIDFGFSYLEQIHGNPQNNPKKGGGWMKRPKNEENEYDNLWDIFCLFVYFAKFTDRSRGAILSSFTDALYTILVTNYANNGYKFDANSSESLLYFVENGQVIFTDDLSEATNVYYKDTDYDLDQKSNGSTIDSMLRRLTVNSGFKKSISKRNKILSL